MNSMIQMMTNNHNIDCPDNNDNIDTPLLLPKELKNIKVKVDEDTEESVNWLF